MDASSNSGHVVLWKTYDVNKQKLMYLCDRCAVIAVETNHEGSNMVKIDR